MVIQAVPGSRTVGRLQASTGRASSIERITISHGGSQYNYSQCLAVCSRDKSNK